MVLKRQMLAIQDVYVPVKRRQTLDTKKVETLAESMLAKVQETPILVRPDGSRFVLVEGLHRLEACKALGETTVPALPGSGPQALIRACYAAGLKTEDLHVSSLLRDRPCRAVIRTAELQTKFRGSWHLTWGSMDLPMAAF